MTDNRKIEDCYAVIANGKVISARFNYQIAQMEAAVKKGVIRKAKIVWIDEPPKPPEPPTTSENESKPVEELWNQK